VSGTTTSDGACGSPLAGGDGRPQLQPLAAWPLGLRRLFVEYRDEACDRYGRFVLDLLRPLPRAVALGMLDGYVVVSGGLPVGLVTSGCHRGIVRIGFLHVRPDWREQGLEQRLLSAVVRSSRESAPGDSTVVSEAMVVSHPDPDALFSAEGFTVVPRWLMRARLGPSSLTRQARRKAPARAGAAGPGGAAGAARTAIRGWQAGDVRGCADVLSDANAGTVDGAIYPELLDASRSVAAVQGILGGSFGRFLRRASSVAVLDGQGARSGPIPQVCGVSLCSRSARGEAFLVELAVRRSLQGRGLGCVLLERSLSQLSLAGLTSVALGVTKSNLPALSLYTRHGFEVTGEFSSYYLPGRRGNCLARPAAVPP
jgi:ribosomal protein S18 acetylase RimI-like enzyme